MVYEYGLHQHMEEFLVKLGSTSKDIATELAKRGIKGMPCSTTKCPINNALRKEFVEVDGLETRWKKINGFTFSTDISFSFSPPKPVEKFILEFDNGMYPELTELTVEEA